MTDCCMKKSVDRTYLGSIVLGLNDAFTYYASIERGESYFHRFFEMLAISMGVAAISFGMGFLIRIWVGGPV